MPPGPIQITPNEFNYTVPIVASDGIYIQVRENGAIVDVISIQFRTFNDNTPKVDVVSAVRLQDGLNGLKKLRDTIDEQIAQFENREP